LIPLCSTYSPECLEAKGVVLREMTRKIFIHVRSRRAFCFSKVVLYSDYPVSQFHSFHGSLFLRHVIFGGCGLYPGSPLPMLTCPVVFRPSVGPLPGSEALCSSSGWPPAIDSWLSPLPRHFRWGGFRPGYRASPVASPRIARSQWPVAIGVILLSSYSSFFVFHCIPLPSPLPPFRGCISWL